MAPLGQVTIQDLALKLFRRQIVSKLRGFRSGEMGQGGEQCRESFETFSRRKRPKFRDGFVAPHEHKTLAPIYHAIEVFREMASHFSNRKRL